MPPTIQANLRPSSSRRSGTEEKKSDLIVPTKFKNTLPDIPFDPKSLKYPFVPDRFVDYKPTSLESSYKYDILSELHLGIAIDLIDPNAYVLNEKAELHPKDAKLVEDEALSLGESKRLKIHSQNVSWLRRTEYISTEATRFQPPNMDKVEAKVGHSIKKNFKETTLFMSVEDQIKAIEKTFQDAKTPILKHHSKPHVHPVEVLPIFPDFKTWKYPCAQVIFDSDPAPVGRPIPAQLEEMSQAMIRGVMDASGEQFVAYFLPTRETMDKRKEDIAAGKAYDDDAEYEYTMAREYNWNVKSKTCKGYEENYFLITRPDGIYYNELETRVRLSKRRVKAGITDITKLVVKHRPLNEMEFSLHCQRERQLDVVKEDEENKYSSSDEDSDEGNKSSDDEKAKSPSARESDDGDSSDTSEDGDSSKKGGSKSDNGGKSTGDEKKKSPVTADAELSDDGSGSSTESSEESDSPGEKDSSAKVESKSINGATQVKDTKSVDEKSSKIAETTDKKASKSLDKIDSEDEKSDTSTNTDVSSVENF